MNPAVLFLDEASAATAEVDETLASQMALNLVSTLRALKKINAKIALNCTQPISMTGIGPTISLSSILGGNKYREEWLFLRDLAARSPIDSGIKLQGCDIDSLELCTALNKFKSRALEWAWLAGTATVSYPHHEDWSGPYVSINYVSLTESCDLVEGTGQIRNASSAKHADIHRDWLAALTRDESASVEQFWDDREEGLPALTLLPRVKGDLEKLFDENTPAWEQAIRSLRELSNAALEWKAPAAQPTFRTKTTPESQTRRQLCHFDNPFTGKSELFEWHARFTGNVPGRIHFRMDFEAKRLIVAYVGRKLD